MKNGFTILTLLILFFAPAKAQKIDSIFFNLYTDSLKKGVYNYINVDGKSSDGKFMPLMDNEILFQSSSGSWHGNSLILDSATKEEKISITATLKANTEIHKTIVIYLKKVNTDPILKSEKEIIEGYRKRKKGQ